MKNSTPATCRRVIRLLGGGWVTSQGYGTTADGPPAAPDSRAPAIPPWKDVFPRPLTRYGRFDDFTKLGCAAAALALRDAGLDGEEQKRPVGFILSSRYECYATDIAYYRTTEEGGGVFASPNLFSYTLPGVVLGECAVCFRLTGPTFVVGERAGGLGAAALRTAALFLGNGGTDTILAGWLDAPPEGMLRNGAPRAPDLPEDTPEEPPPRGALVAVLSTAEPADSADPGVVVESELHSGINIMDLFRSAGPRV